MTQVSPAVVAASTVLAAPTSQEATSVIKHLAHELRQPLSTIESIAFYLGMVLPATEEKALQQIEKLQGLVEQANTILADAIHYLQATPPKPVAVDLGSMIARCFDEDRFPCTGTFRFEHADQLPLVRLDPTQGEHLLRTLFTVASQLSRSHGAVVIRTAALCHAVEISVSCPIPSMNETSPQSLMDPFNPHLTESSGLALASVKRIAESHGGYAAVHSCENDLTLRVSLPVA